MRNAIHALMQGVVVPWSDLQQLPDSVKDQLARPRRTSLPRIAVLYYGGTAFMHRNAQGKFEPTDDPSEMLKSLNEKGLKDIIDMVWFRVTNSAIDSTNARWVHWASIGNAIKLLYDMADGFVVIGGTDTMAHMLSAMNFMFPNIGKPIIGCGAQVSIEELGDDATRNIYFALLAAASNLSGAHLAFDEDLLHGLHVFKVKDRGFRAFTAPTRWVIGNYDGSLNVFDRAPRRNPIVTASRLDYFPHFREGVKVVELSPATPSDSILHDAKDPACSSLLLITFGAGNVRNEPLYEGEMTHFQAIRRITDSRYPVVLGSPMIDGKVDSPYAAGVAVSPEIGGISGGDTCGPTLHVKMMRCLHRAWIEGEDRLNYDKFRDLMMTDHVGELSMVHKT